MDTIDRFRGCLVGLAVGDAVGTTVEFRPRGSFAPVTDMVGGGPFRLAAGQWTDDTAMALCLATSLLDSSGFDAADQMERYCRWRETGYLSCTGHCFDVGNTTAAALARFRQTGSAFAGNTSPHSAGNGSLMRLAPVPLFCYPDIDAAVRLAGESSRTTHGAAECIAACQLLAKMICLALDGRPREEITAMDPAGFAATPAIAALAAGDYRHKHFSAIRGSGYVVQSLEAALFCFTSTGDYEQAILAATNLGDDADTTAAICGQLAGAHYGIAGIPGHWRERLAMRDDILTLAERLYRREGAEPSRFAQ